MQAVLRVPMHRFKYNMAPLVHRAKAGDCVIVTNNGTDDFQIVPCMMQGPPPVSDTPLDAAAYRGIDTDAPAFAPMERDETPA